MMSLRPSHRVLACALGLVLAAGSLTAQRDDGEVVERVPGQKPTTARLSDMPTAAPPEAFAPPTAHIQGEVKERVRRGVELVPSGKNERFDREIDTEVETVDPEPWTDGPGATEALVVNRDAIDFTGSIPPDAVLAANDSHILAAVNRGLTIYDAVGNELEPFKSFTDFFASRQPAGWQGNYFDPRVAFVIAENKFLVLALGRDQSAQSSFLFLAVSQTSNPRGDWWFYRYRADKNAQSDMWLDFPGVAGDGEGVYMTGNYFTESDNDFQYAGLWSIGPSVYSGGAGNGIKMTNITWPSTGSKVFNLQPAVPYSIAGGQETFFAATYFSSGDEVLLITLTGDRTVNPRLAKQEIGIRSYDAIGENVDQPGTSQDLDGGDSRVGNAVYAQRRVYVALSTDTDNDGDRAGVILAKLNVDTGNREWQRLTTGSDGKYYVYPAVAIGSGSGTSPKIAWFGTWASNTQNPSTLYRLFDSGSTHRPIEFRSTRTGNDDYQVLDRNNSNRWGDYSGAVLKVGTEDMCGISQYASSSTTWRTRLVCVN